MKRCSLLVLLIAIQSLLWAQRTEHAVVAVIDGARYSETFGDATHQFIPTIWDSLRPQGMIYTRFYNNGITETNPGHASIVTGTWQSISNDGLTRPHLPTMFEYYRQEKNISADQNFVVLGKTKLAVLAYSDFTGFGSAYGATVVTSSNQYSDPDAFETMAGVLLQYRPRLSILNLPATDRAGHDSGWVAYTRSLRSADSLVTRLWRCIQSDSIMRGRTTLFVVNDHGRHTADFRSHGDGCEGCRHIMLLVIGPDTPVGEDSTLRQQIDIVPTIGALMRFSTPYSAGTVLGSAVSTSIAQIPLIPERMELMQNYPNPFNPATVIRYSVGAASIQHSGASTVRLSVCDILGREVAVLVNEEQKPGSYEVRFDGAGLASGVYLYRLQAGSFMEVKRMLLVK